MRGIKLVRIFGIDINLDSSWFFIFLLMSWLFISNYTAAFKNIWAGIAAGLSTTILFFFSLVCHEMAHSLVGRRFGFSIKRITLLFFGGVAQLEGGDLKKAKAEFSMSVAGPVSSFILGMIFYLFTVIFQLAGLFSVSEVSFWLAKINILLGLFNLIPCFPMDGGRVLRAIFNAVSKDFLKATKRVFRIQQVIITGVIVVSVINILVGKNFVWLWYAFMALYIDRLGKSEYRRVIMEHSLAPLRVQDLMQKVPIKTKLPSVAPEFILLYPDRFCNPDDSVLQVLERMNKSNMFDLSVVKDGRVVGYITLKDILKKFEVKRIK